MRNVNKIKREKKIKKSYETATLEQKYKYVKYITRKYKRKRKELK